MEQRLPDLVEDTIVNVAQLLKQQVGATRTFSVELSRLALDDNLIARDIEATIRLTRIATGILADGEVSGTARLECVRCLTEFDTAFTGEFDAEFRPIIDVISGELLPFPEGDDIFMIDHNHELDLAELLRQVILVELPMRPTCGEACPGFQSEFPPSGDTGDERMAVLRTLLEQGGE